LSVVGERLESDVMEQPRFVVKLLIAEFAIVIVSFIILRSDPELIRWLFG
jgi:hypothetical protein